MLVYVFRGHVFRCPKAKILIRGAAGGVPTRLLSCFEKEDLRTVTIEILDPPPNPNSVSEFQDT